MTSEQFEGCLLGLALGDALGARHEGGILERLLWRLIGTTVWGELRWTDDTQMALDLAESLVANGALYPDDLARRFASGYHWSRGYGPGAGSLLKRIARGADWREVNCAIFPEGSYGNGGAMRAPMVGLFYAKRPRGLVEAARLSASITHAHPLGIEGAVLIAAATALVLDVQPPLDVLRGAAAHCVLDPYIARLAIALRWLQAGDTPDARTVARQLGNGVAASDSCVTALYVALHFHDQPFLKMLDFIARIGGDVDTLGAMAGAIWGAAHGIAALPAEQMARLEQAERLRATAAALHAAIRLD